jgi:hypothetical protein
MHSLSTFGARMSHGHTRTHKTCHDMDLGEATTLPLILFSIISHKSYIQMSFSLGPQVESLKILEIRTFDILEAHNFLCRSVIEKRF